jgi:hypothetical protein
VSPWFKIPDFLQKLAFPADAAYKFSIMFGPAKQIRIALPTQHRCGAWRVSACKSPMCR